MRLRNQLAALVYMCVALSACDPFHDSDFDRYERARAQWERSSDGNYDMTLTISCFCAFEGPMIVSVRNGDVVAARRVSDGQPVNAQTLQYIPSVDGIFDRIRDALRGNHGTIELEFEPFAGYPIRANLDPIVNAVDDEVSYRIDNMQRMASLADLNRRASP